MLFFIYAFVPPKLHSCGIFHRDVKPENILIKVSDTSLCSFSLLKCNSVHVKETQQTFFFLFKNFFIIYLHYSITVWSLATLARVGACTPSLLTRSTSPHAGTEPRSASWLTATTASRWTCGAQVVSSMRSWGRFCIRWTRHFHAWSEAKKGFSHLTNFP